jgi:diapolycopene oxygenase
MSFEDQRPAPRAIVVGAGIAGLAAATRLAIKGYDVDVFETRVEPGGKLHQFTLGAYRFDAGPSLFTMPELVTELFEAAGRQAADYFTYRQVEASCNYFWEDGTVFKAATDPAQFALDAARVFGVDARVVRRHLDYSRQVLDSTGRFFLEKPIHRLGTWFDRQVIRHLARLKPSYLLRTMHGLHRQTLQQPALVQLFDRFATYNGSDPYRSPALLSMIAAVEHGKGVFFPEGGMASIPQAVYALAQELGVRFHFNTRVEEILVREGKVHGVRTSTATYDAEVVVSNMDIWYTYRQLLPGQSAPERILQQERSSSAIVFYWGINRTFPELGLHNIFFSADYRKEFGQLFQTHEVGEDPTVYVNISSKCAPEDAPPGGENWFVMINAPRDLGQDWETIPRHLRIRVLQKLEGILGVDIEPHIVEEKMWDPPGIDSDTLSYQGSLYGNSSNNALAAFLRHANDNRRIKGLYHVGGTVHPGGGIPLCFLSARIATEAL